MLLQVTGFNLSCRQATRLSPGAPRLTPFFHGQLVGELRQRLPPVRPQRKHRTLSVQLPARGLDRKSQQPVLLLCLKTYERQLLSSIEHDPLPDLAPLCQRTHVGRKPVCLLPCSVLSKAIMKSLEIKMPPFMVETGHTARAIKRKKACSRMTLVSLGEIERPTFLLGANGVLSGKRTLPDVCQRPAFLVLQHKTSRLQVHQESSQ